MNVASAGDGVKDRFGVLEDDTMRPVIEVRKGGVEAIREMAEEWRLLCEEGRFNQPYYRPEWVEAFLRNYCGKNVIFIISARTKGRLTSVLPLIPRERTVISGLKVNTWCGPSMPDGWPTDIVVASGPEGEAAVPAIWRTLEGLPGWDILELPNVPSGGAAENLIGFAAMAGCPTYRWQYMNTPTISLAGWDGGEPLRLARSKNLRHTIRRILNKVGDGNLVLRRFDLATDEVFEKFYAIEQKSWKGKEGKTVAGDGKLRGFYTDVAKEAGSYGYLSFYFLELNGREIASRLALTQGGRYHEMECVHDEEFDEYAPGHLMINEILRDCGRRGISEISFSGHSYEHKERWTTASHPHSNLYIFRNNLYGRALYAAKYVIRPYIKKVKEAMNMKAKGGN